MQIPRVDELLRTAIRTKHMIRLTYQNAERIIEPHDYGIKDGTAMLLAYQTGGRSSGKLPGWRWMRVDGISDAHLLTETFPGGRSEPSQRHHTWDELFIRVDPEEPTNKP